MPEKPRKERDLAWQEMLPALLPAILAFFLFLPALWAGFVNWDDPLYVYQNPHIRSLDIRWVFTAVVASNYHPLTLLSHTLDYALFGLSPWGHHLTNIVLHAVNSALVFLLARALLLRARPMVKDGGQGRVLAPLFAALVFAAHPLHVESVVWVAERKDVLSALFFLLSILSYLRYSENRRIPAYGLTLILFVLALLSKPMAISLPVVLLILDYYPLQRIERGWAVVIEKVPFFVLSGASAIITLWAQKTGGAVTLMRSYPLATRLVVAIRGYVFYMYKLIFPATLAPYYPLPLNPGVGDPLFLASLLILVIITALSIYLAIKGHRAIPALWSYYIVTLFPVIGIVQVGSQAAADRYAYIPTMGFFILAASIFTRKKGAARPIGVAIFVAALVLFGLKTTRAIPVWKDSLSLWTHEIGYLQSHGGEDKVAGVIARYNRAKAFESLSLLEEAAREYGRVLAINPRYLDAYLNRGVIYARLGRYNEAIGDFTRAMDIEPTSAAAHYNRARAYGALGDMEKARYDFEMARRLGWGR